MSTTTTTTTTTTVTTTPAAPVFQNESFQGASFPCVVLCIGSAENSVEFSNKNSVAVAAFLASHRAVGTDKDGNAVAFKNDRQEILEPNKSSLQVAALIEATKELDDTKNISKAGEQEGGNGSGGGDAASAKYRFDMIESRFGNTFWKIESKPVDGVKSALGKASAQVLEAYAAKTDPGLVVYCLSHTVAQSWILEHRVVLYGMFGQIRIIATSPRE